ncbi:MAG: DUF1028 domain-containing protein [Candidatus Zixiibacteriota bacterium]
MPEPPSTATQEIATFSIVAGDSITGELGVAVASRFFAVGSVVPWAKAGIGAVATQSYANTTYGWRGLELLEQGLTPQQAIDSLKSTDSDRERRQVGIVAADGNSATFTGYECNSWAGGRKGPGYAIQGNILAGAEVVESMEKAYLESGGSLAERLYAALLAGDSAGGDSRGKQSAALLVVKEGAGYGGYTDRAIDIRVDDHTEPFKELGRLLTIARMNYLWNEAWTAFTEKRFEDARDPMEKAAELAPSYAEVHYDLAVIRLARGDKNGAYLALQQAFELNPKLAKQAAGDQDLAKMRGYEEFKLLMQEFGQ